MVGTWRQNLPLGVGYEYSAQEPTYRVLNSVQLCFTNEAEPSFQRANVEQRLRSRHLSPTQSTRTQCCTASKADRIRLLRQEAAERLADIERRKQLLVAELLQKKLEADIANLQCYSNEEPNTKLQIEDRSCHADPNRNELICDKLPARTSHATTPVQSVLNNREPKPERFLKDHRVNSPRRSYLRTEQHIQEKNFEMLRPTKDTLAFDTIKQNRFDNLCQTIPQELLCYEHLQNLDPSEVCNQKTQLRMLIDSNNFELIVSKRLTGGRNEPVASPELGWANNGTTRRATIINEDDERVLCLSAGSCTKSARHELGAIVDLLEPDAMSVTDVRTFHVTIQTEEAAQLQLPRYHNTKGVQTFQHQEISYHKLPNKPKHNAAQERSLAERLDKLHDSQVIERSSHLAKLDPTIALNLLQVCGELDACIMSDRAKRPIRLRGRHLFKRLAQERRAVGLMNNKRNSNVIQQKCWEMIIRAKEKKKRHKRTGDGGFHRTIKTPAVLTKIKKLRESFAEGRMLRTGASCHTPRRQ